MTYTILDCYTDEPAGLGVPPYLGIYPRYVAGYLNEDVNYITIDDLRLWKKNNSIIKETKISQKTDITTYNLTINHKNTEKIIVRKTRDYLRDGGKFIVYQYSTHMKKYLRIYFNKVSINFEPRNLPPIFIMVCEKI